MSHITIVPKDQVVYLDGIPARPVDMTSVDPDIHAIEFDTVTDKGYVEFKADPDDGVIPPTVSIQNLDPWESQVSEAEEIIFCAQNPKVFYQTVQPVGLEVLVAGKGWPQPEDTTEQKPPEKPSEPGFNLYWTGSEFKWSQFPVDLDLASAKDYMKSEVNTTAFNLLKSSDWLVVRQAESGVPVPGEWGSWRSQVRTESDTKRAEIEDCEDLTALATYCESSEFFYWPPTP